MRRSLIVICAAILLQQGCLWNKKDSVFPKYDEKIYNSKKEYLYIVKGIRFEESGNFEKALELYERALKQNPKSIAYYWEGLAYENKARNTVSDYCNARKKNMRASPPDENLIKTWGDKSVVSYETALKSFPQNDDINFRCGKTALDITEDMDKAGEYLKKASELKPDKHEYNVALAEYYLFSKNFTAARREAEIILKARKSRHKTEAYWIMGRIEAEQRSFLKSIELLKTSLSYSHTLNMAYYDLARAYEETQATASAKEYYKKFISSFTATSLRDVAVLDKAEEALEQGGRKGEK